MKVSKEQVTGGSSARDSLNTQERLNDFEDHYRQWYTSAAGHYDKVRFGRSGGQKFNLKEQQFIYKLLNLKPNETVLDCAAGTGRIAAYLAEQGNQVTGLDLTPNMLFQAQARSSNMGLTNVQLINGNGRKLPFGDGEFDAVISIRFLHLFPAVMHRPFVLEMWRVLRPGGVLLIEFDSALALGGLLTWNREAYRRFVLGDKPRYYTWPQHLTTTFSGIKNISLHGVSFPGSLRLQEIYPGVATMLDRSVSHGWRSFLGNQFLVKAIKT